MRVNTLMTKQAYESYLVEQVTPLTPGEQKMLVDLRTREKESAFQKMLPELRKVVSEHIETSKPEGCLNCSYRDTPRCLLLHPYVPVCYYSGLTMDIDSTNPSNSKVHFLFDGSEGRSS